MIASGLKFLHAVVRRVEHLYLFLVESLWRELIEGEKNVNQARVLFTFLVFIAFAVIAFYLEPLVDGLAVLAVFSFLFTQIEGILNGKRQRMREAMEYIRPVELVQELFHSVAMILFLLILSHLLPRAGHFIMIWLAPWLHLSVPPLAMDLSLTGIWSLFSFELKLIDVLELSALVLSTVIAMYDLWQFRRMTRS